MIQPFNRRAQVIIGPFAESEGAADPTLGVVIEGDGTPDKARIGFSVKKHIMSTASPTIVRLYNLSYEHRKAILDPGLRIEIKAGWSNTEMWSIFTGSILASFTQREGADLVTEIYSLASYTKLTKAVVRQTFLAQTPIRDIVRTIASGIPGVNVSDANIDIPYALVAGSAGLTIVDPTNEALFKLARQYGFSCWIEDGIFHTLMDKQRKTGPTPVISTENGYLMRAEAMLVPPDQLIAGVSITSLFHPQLHTGGGVELISTSNPKLNGVYTVHAIDHSGDTHSQTWTSHVESHWTI
jgi:hypothetical protein